MLKNIIVVVGGFAVFCLASAVHAAGCSNCEGTSNQQYRALSGPPCFSPPGCASMSGNLTPGCHDCQPSPCDNAWDGYCEKKAKYQAFFTWVGTPRKPCYYGFGRNCSPMVVNQGGCASPTIVKEAPAIEKPAIRAVAPTPAPKPDLPPSPEPEKTSRAKVLYPWMR
jgi:hypothetical protein